MIQPSNIQLFLTHHQTQKNQTDLRQRSNKSQGVPDLKKKEVENEGERMSRTRARSRNTNVVTENDQV